MTELVCSQVYRMLVARSVPEESVSTLFSSIWVEAKRARLGRFGGSRLEAFKTEMQAFRAEFKNPSVGYRLFKNLVVGTATLLLPARRFYQVRNWYAQKQLGHYRDRFVKADIASSSFRHELRGK
jgi:hypothetical protein